MLKIGYYAPRKVFRIKFWEMIFIVLNFIAWNKYFSNFALNRTYRSLHYRTTI